MLRTRHGDRDLFVLSSRAGAIAGLRCGDYLVRRSETGAEYRAGTGRGRHHLSGVGALTYFTTMQQD
jgi:hypothetical protein